MHDLSIAGLSNRCPAPCLLNSFCLKLLLQALQLQQGKQPLSPEALHMLQA